jgi:hypothetical protein
MRVTITGTTRIAREVESTRPQRSLTHPALGSAACRRCGGMLVEEHCMDMHLGKMERRHWARRCIQCGDLIDEIILRNRCASRQTLKKIDPTASRGQAFAALPPRDGKEGRYATLSHASSTLRRHPPLQTIVTIR